jgi:phosphoheptose isomerase
MKKTLSFLGVLMITTVLITSCGSAAIESDAKKVAELQCRAQKLAQQAMSGDMTVLEESTQIAAEATALANELKGKYESENDRKKFAEALSTELKNCK